VKVVDKNQ
jgi:hypothetical protein